jgi:mannose-6-phosphate isomerase
MPVKYFTTPWGAEEIWANTDKYVGKILYINPNSKLSLSQNQVQRTIRVLKGILYIRHHVKGNKDLIVSKFIEGDVYNISSSNIESFEAGEEAVELIEISAM